MSRVEVDEEDQSLLDGHAGTSINDTENSESENQFLRPVLAEFVGTTLFVYVGCMSISDNTVTDAALGHGFALTVLVACFGHISGAHYNPCVTLGALLVGAIKIKLALAYFVAQILGGILGAACARGSLKDATIFDNDVYWSINGGGQTLGQGVNVGEGILVEMLLTAILVSTVLMTAIDKESKSSLAPVYIGLALAGGIIAGARTTGGSLNPARSFGPAVVLLYHDASLWTYHYVYWIGPILGTLLSTAWYKFIFASQKKSQPRVNSPREQHC